MKNILILGSAGFVGKNLFDYLSNIDDFNIFGTIRSNITNESNIIQFDVDNIDKLESILINKSIDIVINCIAMANVDQCNLNRDLSRKINYTFVKNLIEILNKQNVKLINFSTNAVYSGDNPPYDENDKKTPKNIYGKDKQEADDLIEMLSNNFVIARVMTLFGKTDETSRSNPSDFIAKNLQSGNEIYLVSDVYNNFLYIKDLVKVISLIIKNDECGVFNISGNEIINRYEFGLIIAKSLNLDESLLISCTSDKFGMMASRAPNTSFDNRKVKLITNVNFMSIEQAIKDIYL